MGVARSEVFCILVGEPSPKKVGEKGHLAGGPMVFQGVSSFAFLF